MVESLPTRNVHERRAFLIRSKMTRTQSTTVFPSQTRTVDGITIVPRLRAYKQPNLKLHNIHQKLSKQLETFLQGELPRISKGVELRFSIGSWYMYIRIIGKIRRKKKFVLQLRDMIVGWLSQQRKI